VGWALYELTTQPALGAVAVCLKFGWEDFRTARWLRRRDPNRRRGRACFWLYVGNAPCQRRTDRRSLASCVPFSIAPPARQDSCGPVDVSFVETVDLAPWRAARQGAARKQAGVAMTTPWPSACPRGPWQASSPLPVPTSPCSR